MGMPFDYNYHTHTSRCGHATGNDEDYVKKAIEGHYRILGFSDHVIWPDYAQFGMRGNPKLAKDYYQSIRDLQGKYQKDIQLYLGYEAEWCGERYQGYYHDLLASGTLDYLILGQHGFFKDNQFVFYSSLNDKHAALAQYTQDLMAGMRSHLFACVAHPDCFLEWYGPFDAFAQECSIRLIEVAAAIRIPLEINIGHSKWRNQNPAPLLAPHTYPFAEFWSLVAEAGARAIFGVDAHAPNELLTAPFDWAREFLDENRLNYTNRLDLPFRLVETPTMKKPM
jgi:histidinol-phosphatase (PHP family)